MVASQGLSGNRRNQYGQIEPVRKVIADVLRLELDFSQVVVHPFEDSLCSVVSVSNLSSLIYIYIYNY